MQSTQFPRTTLSPTGGDGEGLFRQIQEVDQQDVLVRAALKCGWCGREVDDVEGRMEAVRGRLHLATASGLFRLSDGWPRCLHCGGPLFVEDWKVIRPERRRPLGPREPDEEAEPAERPAAA